MGQFNYTEPFSGLLTPVPTQLIYNEGWGQLIEGYPEFGLTDLVKSLDPTRLVDSTSGWCDHGAGDYSVSTFVELSRCSILIRYYRTITTTPILNVVLLSIPSCQVRTIRLASASKENSEGSETTFQLSSRFYSFKSLGYFV
jgi:hypothetical protein